jgi:hypothetical protein
MSGGAPVTSAGEVAAAARAVGVLLGVVCDGIVGGVAGVAMVVVAAHGGVWVVYRDPFSVLGWVAARAAADLSALGGPTVIEVLEESAGWLGAADLEPERIVGNLLDSDALAVDLHLAEPFVPTGAAGPLGCASGGDTPSGEVGIS